MAKSMRRLMNRPAMLVQAWDSLHYPRFPSDLAAIMSKQTPAVLPSSGRLERLLSFLSQDPDNLNLLADTADEALRVGDSDTARSTVEHALNIERGSPFFRLRLSSVAISEQNFEDALAITSELIGEGRDDVAIRYNHAFALLSAARYAEARDVLETLREDHADYAGIVPLLIRSYHYLGELDRAIEVGLSRLEAVPADGVVAGMLSLLYFDRNDYVEAGKRANEVLESEPENLDALLAAGGSALAVEDSVVAKGMMHRAISVQPRNGRAWANLGMAEMLELNLPAAHEALSSAVRYMPEHIGTWIALGWAQLLERDIAGAEASFRSALALDENFGETHGGLAAVAAMKGQWEEAEYAAKIARRLDPKSMSHQYVQVVKAMQGKEPELVSRLLQRALAEQSSPAGGSLLEMLERVVRNKRP